MAQLNMSLDKMPAGARELYEKLKKDRGSLEGMYLTLLNHPALCERVSAVGTFLRFGATLPGDVREVMILLTGHALAAEYEWLKHVPAARAAGVTEAVIDAIGSGRPLAPLDADYGLVEQVHATVTAGQSVSQALQDAVIAKWGVSGVLELVVLVGFYGLIGGILKSFDVPRPQIEGGG
jgi:4-carboxymuconolactone decarboxylase